MPPTPTDDHADDHRSQNPQYSMRLPDVSDGGLVARFPPMTTDDDNTDQRDRCPMTKECPDIASVLRAWFGAWLRAWLLAPRLALLFSGFTNALLLLYLFQAKPSQAKASQPRSQTSDRSMQRCAAPVYRAACSIRRSTLRGAVRRVKMAAYKTKYKNLDH